MNHFEDSAFHSSAEDESTGHNSAIKLAEGGTSIIYTFMIDRQRYAKKVLKPSFRNHPQYLAACNREFAIGQELTHPNIIRYQYLGKDASGPYIIQEFIDGCDFASYYAQQQTLPLPARLERFGMLLLQLLGAVEYLHRKGITHGDIKPGNILITHETQNLKLIDFGHARRYDFATEKGGTAGYLPPEEVSHVQQDIYAVAVTIQQVLDKDFKQSGCAPLIKACIQSNGKQYDSFATFSSTLQKALRRRKWHWAPIAAVTAIMVLVFAYLSARQVPFQESSTPQEQKVQIHLSMDTTVRGFGRHLKDTPIIENQKEQYATGTVSQKATADTSSVKSTHPSWEYQYGMTIYDAFADTFYKMPADIKLPELRGLFNDLVMYNFQDFKARLEKDGVFKDSWEYEAAMRQYEKGYFMARKMTDTLIERKFIELKSEKSN